MYLWNPQAPSNQGLNQGQGIANVYRFGTPNAGWNALTNTITEPLFGNQTNNSFLVFATGPANVGGSNLPAVATTLRPKGSLRVGDVEHTNLAATYHLLGNPYASALDIGTLREDNENFNFWMLDPNLGDFGAYVTYNGTAFTPSNAQNAPVYSLENTRIESGQAFFVRPTTPATFTFKEPQKEANVSYSMSRSAIQTETSITGVRLNLYKPLDNQYKIADGILAVFDENETNAVTGIDARKLSNSNENIMFRTSNISLAIDMRAMPTLADELAVRMTNTVANTAYQIHAYVESFENMPLQAYLLDTQTQQLTAIPMDGSSIVYPFTGMNATNTQPDERFKVVFQNTALSNNDWEKPIMSLYPNPATKGSIFMNTTASSAELRVELTNIHGQKVLNSIAEPVGAGQYRLDVSKLSSGVYLLKAIDTDFEWTHKIIIH
jgi:hypothetical protein